HCTNSKLMNNQTAAIGNITAPSPRVRRPAIQATPRAAANSQAAEKISLTTKLVIAAIVCCILEGAVRKWVVPGSGFVIQGVFYFSKDVFFFFAALTALNERQRSPQISQLVGILTLASLLVVIAALPNIADIALVGSVLSLRSIVVIPFLVLAIAP